MTLYDDKTGRQYPAANYGDAAVIARNNGLTDWTWCPSTAPVPATMRETTRAMQARKNDQMARTMLNGGVR